MMVAKKMINTGGKGLAGDATVDGSEKRLLLVVWVTKREREREQAETMCERSKCRDPSNCCVIFLFFFLVP